MQEPRRPAGLFAAHGQNNDQSWARVRRRSVVHETGVTRSYARNMVPAINIDAGLRRRYLSTEQRTS